jgi:penicillin-binding protein 2
VPISRPEPRRRLKLPRNLPGGRQLQPYSRADAPYFRSPGFYVRVGGLAVVVAAGLTLLLLRAWSIQVLHGKQYARAAHSQAFRTVDLLGARGAILDDKGRLIAGTTGHAVVDADAASLGSRGVHGRWNPSPAGLEALGRLARLTGKSRGVLVARIRSGIYHAPFAPAVVIEHPTAALTSYVQERSAQFPGFKVGVEDTRSYPQGGFGGEFLGLLGQVSKTELKSGGAYKGAKSGEVVGQSGVEAAYDWILNKGFVRAKIPVDSLGRIAGPLRVPRQQQPPTLQLSIDTRLQKAAQNALLYGMEQSRLNGSSPTGASAVAIDPWTGAIKAIVSYPTFDQKAAAEKPSYLSSLFKDKTSPTLNRAISGAYPTGSTFKPIIAEAALSAGIITPSTPLACTGVFYLGNFPFHNVDPSVNATMTLPTALEESCDTWFYRLGNLVYQHNPRAQGTLIQDWASKLGLGRTPPVDLTGATPGYLPRPGKTFDKVNGSPWTEGQTINLAIGQGRLQVSPLQLAVAYSALINGGKVVRPHVAQAVIKGRTRNILHFKPVRTLKLSPYTWAIRQGLYEAANDPGGTSQPVFAGFPLKVAGKTGTAEPDPVSSWYASWAPYNSPKLVVVANVEHGGFGAQAAAPIAKKIYEAYFHLKNS